VVRVVVHERRALIEKWVPHPHVSGGGRLLTPVPGVFAELCGCLFFLSGAQSPGCTRDVLEIMRMMRGSPGVAIRS
jgi:hypothetical protein